MFILVSTGFKHVIGCLRINLSSSTYSQQMHLDFSFAGVYEKKLIKEGYLLM